MDETRKSRTQILLECFEQEEQTDHPQALAASYYVNRRGEVIMFPQN